MRKLLLSLLLLSLMLSSAAAATLTVAADAELPQAVREQLSAALDREAEAASAADLSAHVSNVLEAEGGIYILTLELNGSEYRVAIDGNDRSSAADVLHELMQYTREGQGPSLDYIYGNSYSSVSLEEPTSGRVYRLKGEGGKTLALFVGEKAHYGAVELSPFYVREAYTGLPLEKGIGLKISASAGFIFAPEFRVGGKVMFSYLPLLHPFSPQLGFSYLTDRNGGGVYLGVLGAGYSLSLGSIFPVRFTLVEDGTISASVFLAAGYDGGFAGGGGWSVQYEHAITSWLYWSVGGGQDVIWSVRQNAISVNQYSFTAGMGVLF